VPAVLHPHLRAKRPAEDVGASVGSQSCDTHRKRSPHLRSASQKWLPTKSQNPSSLAKATHTRRDVVAKRAACKTRDYKVCRPLSTRSETRCHRYPACCKILVESLVLIQGSTPCVIFQKYHKIAFGLEPDAQAIQEEGPKHNAFTLPSLHACSTSSSLYLRPWRL
jgi:hypothetical protein